MLRRPLLSLSRCDLSVGLQWELSVYRCFAEADIRVLRDPSTANAAYDDIMKYLKDPSIGQKSVSDCLWLMRHIIHGRLGKVWSVDQMKNVVGALHELHPEAVAFKPAPEPLPPQEIQK